MTRFRRTLGHGVVAGAAGVTMLNTSPTFTWPSAADWTSDILPHLGYGAAAYATLRALDNHT